MRNRNILIIASIVVIFIAAIFAVQWIRHGGWPVSSPSGDALPPNVQYVSPADGQFVNNSHGFCVGLNFSLGNRVDEEEKSKIKFYLDGVNISEHMHEPVELEYPTGVFEPCFRREDPLKSGWHSAVLQYSDSKKITYRYTWNFQTTIDE